MDPLQTTIHSMAGVVIDLDGSIFIQLVIIALVFFVLRALVFRPYLATLDARETKTLQTRERATQLQIKARALEARYETELATARDKAVTTRQTLRAEGTLRREQFIAEARRISTAKMDAAHAAIDAQYEGARADLKTQVDQIAGLIVDKVLAETPRQGH